MNTRLFVIVGIPIVGVLIVLTAFGVGAREVVAERGIDYRGERYTGPVLATQAEVEDAGAQPTEARVAGRQVFAERRTPPRALFLLRPDGRFDAYVLARGLE